MTIAPWLAATLALTTAGCGARAEPHSSETPTVARVRTQTLERRVMTEEITLYGLVVPGLESRHTAAVPFESVVRRVYVQVGEHVAMGAPLIEIDPSPDTQLALGRARASAAAASEAVNSVRARFASRLATRLDVTSAERVSRDATLRVRSLAARGATRTRILTATGPSVVTAAPVAEGVLVVAGRPLIELNSSAHLEVRFGVEVEDVQRVVEGAALTVHDLRLGRRMSVDAVVRAVGESVDGVTRLVSLYAALPEDSGLLLGQRVTGVLTIVSEPTFVVSRSALVPEPDRVVLYTVGQGDVAVSHAVRLGLEDDVEVEIFSTELVPGMRVVVSGAAVLGDGTAIAEMGQ